MAMALTPQEPFKQFEKIDKPFGLFAGSEDELFDPEKVMLFAKLPPQSIREKSVARIVDGAKHLSILVDAGDLVYEAVKKISSD